MVERSRRWFVRAGVAGGTLGVAGCLRLGESDGGDGEDGSDGGTESGSDDEDGGDGDDGGTTAAATTAANAATTTARTTAAPETTRTTAAPTTAPPTTAPTREVERYEPIEETIAGGEGSRDVFEGTASIGDQPVALGSFDQGDTSLGWAAGVDPSTASGQWEVAWEIETETTLFDGAPVGDRLIVVGTAESSDTSDLVLGEVTADGTRGASARFGEGETLGRGAARLGEGMIGVGATERDGAKVGWGVKLDGNYEVDWRQAYRTPNADQTAFNAAVDVGPRAAVFVGAAITDGVSQPWAVRIDETGEATINETYEFDDGPALKAATVTPDGRLLAVGETFAASDRNGAGFVMKVGQEPLWVDRTNPLGGGTTLFDVAVTDDGNYVVAGGVSNQDTFDAYLAGYAPDGTRRWEGRWGTSDADAFSSVTQTADGLFCTGLTGWTGDAGEAWLALVEPP